MYFHLVQNRKENCHHDYIPFNVKGNANIVSQCIVSRTAARLIAVVFLVRETMEVIKSCGDQGQDSRDSNKTRSFVHDINIILNIKYRGVLHSLILDE